MIQFDSIPGLKVTNDVSLPYSIIFPREAFLLGTIQWADLQMNIEIRNV